MLRIQKTAKAVAKIDVLSALSLVAERNNYCRPSINETGVIDIKSGRHPVVEQMINNDMFISNDTFLPLPGFQFHQPGFSFCLGLAELVNLFVISLLDHAAVPDGNGRIFFDGSVNQLINIFQNIQFRPRFLQHGRIKFSQEAVNMGKHFKGTFKCGQIPGIGGLIGDPADQTL